MWILVCCPSPGVQEEPCGGGHGPTARGKENNEDGERMNMGLTQGTMNRVEC